MRKGRKKQGKCSFPPIASRRMLKKFITLGKVFQQNPSYKRKSSVLKQIQYIISSPKQKDKLPLTELVQAGLIPHLLKLLSTKNTNVPTREFKTDHSSCALQHSASSILGRICSEGDFYHVNAVVKCGGIGLFRKIIRMKLTHSKKKSLVNIAETFLDDLEDRVCPQIKEDCIFCIGNIILTGGDDEEHFYKNFSDFTLLKELMNVLKRDCKGLNDLLNKEIMKYEDKKSKKREKSHQNARSLEKFKNVFMEKGFKISLLKVSIWCIHNLFKYCLKPKDAETFRKEFLKAYRKMKKKRKKNMVHSFTEHEDYCIINNNHILFYEYKKFFKRPLQDYVYYHCFPFFFNLICSFQDDREILVNTSWIFIKMIEGFQDNDQIKLIGNLVSYKNGSFVIQSINIIHMYITLLAEKLERKYKGLEKSKKKSTTEKIRSLFDDVEENSSYTIPKVIQTILKKLGTCVSSIDSYTVFVVSCGILDVLKRIIDLEFSKNMVREALWILSNICGVSYKHKTIINKVFDGKMFDLVVVQMYELLKDMRIELNRNIQIDMYNSNFCVFKECMFVIHNTLIICTAAQVDVLVELNVLECMIDFLAIDSMDKCNVEVEIVRNITLESIYKIVKVAEKILTFGKPVFERIEKVKRDVNKGKDPNFVEMDFEEMTKEERFLYEKSGKWRRVVNPYVRRLQLMDALDVIEIYVKDYGRRNVDALQIRATALKLFVEYFGMKDKYNDDLQEIMVDIDDYSNIPTKMEAENEDNDMDLKISLPVIKIGNECAYCKKKGDFMACSGCKTVHYCGVPCQKKQWKIHKITCKRIRKEKKENEGDNVKLCSKNNFKKFEKKENILNKKGNIEPKEDIVAKEEKTKEEKVNEFKKK